ncbi:FHA domain-containing protein [Caballeronia peredens]|nr:FHA domain-containing protein [Caballeronia peredens]
MALATRCPHCETVFKLDPHLLAPHDGRVRCGHCQEVFDAAHHRFELPEETAAPGVAQHAAIIDDEAAVGPSTHGSAAASTASTPAASPEARPLTPRALDLGPMPADAPPAPPPPPVGAHPDEDADRTVYADSPAFAGASAHAHANPPRNDIAPPPAQPDAANEPSAEPAEPARMKQFIRVGTPQPDLPNHARTQADLPPAEPPIPPVPPAPPAPFGPLDDRAEPFIGPVDTPSRETPPPSRRPAPEPAAASAWRDDAEPGFAGTPPGGARPASANEAFPVTRETRAPVPPAAGKNRSRSQGKRIAGIVVAVLLALLLLVQLAWWQRETVMVYVPASHALYSQACDALGCTISPPRAIDGLQIESSGLRQVDGPHKLELKLSLRNRMDVALAYPALELTLLDDKNNVAIRRVLWPQDYARPGTIFAIGLPPQSAQPVVVRLDTGDAVAANYRVQVFYP